MPYCDANYIVSSRTMNAADLAGLVTPADTVPDIDAPDTQAAIAGACQAASDAVDDRLRAVYSGTLPLVYPPGQVKKWVAVLACYSLWQGVNTDPDQNPFRAAEKRVQSDLDGLVIGRLRLDLSAEDGGSASVPTAAGNRGHDASGRKFTPEKMRRLM